jgi:hypothetical protein
LNSGSPAKRVFLTCWLVFAAFWAPFIVREHFPALSLMEDGSLNVERYVDWSEDIFRAAGGAYINNNPGASLTGALVLIPMRPLLTAVERWNLTLPRAAARPDEEESFWGKRAAGRVFYFLLVGFLTVALVMAPATAATAAYLCSRLTQAGLPAARAATIALLYGLGTPVLFRSAYLNHNLLAGNAGFTALLLLWDPRQLPLRATRAAAAGLLAGYALLCDYSGIVIVAATGLYVWLRAGEGRRRWRPLAAFALGVLPCVAGLLFYQAWAFGSLYRPSQHYMTPTAPTSQGYRGFDWPSPALLWANFFDPRFGLFCYCPALLLALGAPFVSPPRFRLPPREIWIALIYFGLFVVFCAANQYSWLQPSTGFRYLVPVVPVLALLAVYTAQELPKVAAWVIAGLSCVESLALAASHNNDVRLLAATLWDRRFAPSWMMRLAHSGIPITPLWPLLFWSLLASALTLIWLWPRPSVRPARPNPSEISPFF